MNHDYIQEHQIVPRYLMGKLEPADRIEFEEHLVDCRRCLDEVELTDDFRHTMQAVVTADASRFTASPTPATWLPNFSASQRVAMLSAAIIIFTGFTALLFFGQNRRFERELEVARTSAATWERRYTDEQQARTTAESQLRQRLAQAAAPLFTLNLTRGADLNAAEPPNMVSISRAASFIVFSLEWQNDPDFKDYRATLIDASGRHIWAADAIPPPSSGALAITLPASLFQAGKYMLTVEGAAAARYSVVGRYSFRTVLSK